MIAVQQLGLERTLDTIAKEIRWHEEESRANFTTAIEHKIEIGMRLIEAKPIVGHGHFMNWCAEQFPQWSERHIRNHMDLARNRQRVADLGDVSMRAALEAIAPPRPESVSESPLLQAAPVPEADPLRNGIAQCGICGNLYDGQSFPTYCPYCRKKSLGVVGFVPKEMLDNPTFTAARSIPVGFIGVDSIAQDAQQKPAHVSYNNGNNEWYTPPEYIAAARRVMASIDLDPASSAIANRIVGATTFFTAEDDGLAQDWRGRVWMNPPYASELIGRFVAKLVEHFVAGDVPEAIVLVNNATETNWFQTLLAHASAVCFPRQRVRFLDPDGNPGAPLQGQAILYLGNEPKRFSVFSTFGTVLYGRPTGTDSE